MRNACHSRERGNPVRHDVAVGIANDRRTSRGAEKTEAVSPTTPWIPAFAGMTGAGVWSHQMGTGGQNRGSIVCWRPL